MRILRYAGHGKNLASSTGYAAVERVERITADVFVNHHADGQSGKDTCVETVLTVHEDAVLVERNGDTVILPLSFLDGVSIRFYLETVDLTVDAAAFCSLV